MENGTDEDKKKFAEDFKHDIDLVKTIAPELEQRSDLRERLNLFYTAFYQKQLSKSNKNLAIATWVLALSTIAFTVNEIYGAKTADEAIKVAIQLVLIIIIFGAILELAFGVLEKVKKLTIWLFKQLWRLIIQIKNCILNLFKKIQKK